MKTITTIFALAATLSLTPPAIAHHHTHDELWTQAQSDEQNPYDFGEPGKAKEVVRTITVDMTDNMRFTPSAASIKQGETIRFEVVNKGQVLHELVLGTKKDIADHQAAMRKHPGRAHDAPYTVHVKAGKTGEVIWKFTDKGEFDIACLLPGHYESGMKGKVVVQ